MLKYSGVCEKRPNKTLAIEVVELGIYKDKEGLEYELFEVGEDFLTGDTVAIFRTIHRDRYADNGLVFTCSFDEFEKRFKLHSKQ